MDAFAVADGEVLLFQKVRFQLISSYTDLSVVCILVSVRPHLASVMCILGSVVCIFISAACMLASAVCFSLP